ncbi:hybrid sensor histidine kinase/response regulator [Desulfovibrio psychrotolerans]|uniref:histidine kinase n=1 Tax=Desulfovibrio psychrotolerans TaxID=415242 RepID=A0A7J0BSY3_9BACT|nr:ATP-binding protein [Desulfovibrio psychrotolerans]GFM36827.1 hypothetical protein DSM19430T_15110 [Desulfovibrio psychrotolerans]
MQMFAPPSFTPGNRIRSILLLILCCGMGLLGNYAKLELFFNVDFLFGSIATLFALYYLGLVPGVLCAAIAGSWTYVLWNHPYAIIILVAEAAFIGLLWGRERRNLVLLTVLYWLVLGMPLVWIFYREVMGMAGPSVVSIMLKQGINGISNAVMAFLLILCVNVWKAYFAGQNSSAQPADSPGSSDHPGHTGKSDKAPHIPVTHSYRELLFVTLVSFVLFPGLMAARLNIHEEVQDTERSVREGLLSTARLNSEQFDLWLHQHIEVIAALADTIRDVPLNSPQVRNEVRAALRYNGELLRVGVGNTQGRGILNFSREGELSLPPGGVDYSDRPYFQEINRTLLPVVSWVPAARTGSPDPIIVLAAPVLRQNDFGGFINAVVPVHSLTGTLLSLFRHSGMGATILDNHGIVVTSTNPDRESGHAFTAFSEHGVVREQGIQGEQAGIRIWMKDVSPNISVMNRWKNSVYFTEMPLGHGGWTIIVETTTATHMIALLKLLQSRLLLLMSVVLASVALSWVLAAMLVKPLRQISALTTNLPQKISHGEEPIWPDRTWIAEPAHLVKNFRHMSDSLRARFQDIKESTIRLAAAKDMVEEASRAKSEFLANMSHEIRTPMNGIMGMLQILQSEHPRPDQERSISVAISSSKRLLRLLSDILDLSRVEAGKLEIRHEQFCIRDVLETVATLLEPAGAEKALHFSVDLDPAIPRALMGDSVRVQQILFNLTGNAIKFTEQGHITLSAHLLPSPRPETARVLFSVEDTGRGIPDSLLDKVLEPFSQADGNYTRIHDGAGLGLAIVRRLVRLMNGSMAVESEDGRGTTVHVCITFGMPEQTCTENSGKEDSGPEASGTVDSGKETPLPCSGPFKILLAEDEEVNEMVARRHLERLGHTVTSVSNGQLALEALLRDEFDLVLMDIQMPVMDGVQATRALRTLPEYSRLAQLPVVVMTAHAMSGARETFLETGADGYIAKPFEPDELIRTIDKTMSQAAARPHAEQGAQADDTADTQADVN